MEATLAGEPWLAGQEFSLADIGYAPYLLRFKDLQLEFLWDKRPHIAGWFERLSKRRGYRQAFTDWSNASYVHLMKEKGIEAQARIKAIIAAA